MRFIKHGQTNVLLSIDDQIATSKIINEIESGGYEQREMMFTTRLANPSNRILELGAGLGFISTVICKNMSPKHYTAVEADERLIPHIKRTHHINNINNVNVINGAFISKPNQLKQGFVNFEVSQNFWGSSIKKTGSDIIKTTKVSTYDISEFIKNNSINLLILDIEGGELDLFKHMRFTSLKRIIMEIHPKVLGKKGIYEIFQILSRKKFSYNTNNSCGSVVTFDKIQSSNT